ncbi:MAG TPA: mannonate dehydratase, partial [Gemmatimonadaceae bacterium]|nr:mannonate dehydratase [Gemmatimonadaceae bacterium]
MRMTFRWFGRDDPVRLEYIRQIPGVGGIVSALHDIPVGETWPRDRLDDLASTVDAVGLVLTVIESIPVHEDIKLGKPSREQLADRYAESIRNIGESGVRVLCYNFMPVFDWTRTDLDLTLEDGSTALAYDDGELARIDLTNGTGDLPGWGTAYNGEEMGALLAAYESVPEEQLWENLGWFLERIVPAAESADVKLAIHPDDPPWSIFGLPRIITSGEALERVATLVDSAVNGVTLCTGSLGADPANDVVSIARRLGHMKRIHFAHCRNVKRTGPRAFHEVPHPTHYGDVDMLGVLR